MARILIIGSGTVGEATGVEFALLGHTVTFLDTDQKKVENLLARGYDAQLPGEDSTPDIDFFLICVPTPLNVATGSSDLSSLENALTFVGNNLALHSHFSTVVLRSTVPVGTASEYAIPLLEKISRKLAGKDFAVCSNPEYLREQSAAEDFRNARLILIGSEDEASAKPLAELYQEFTGKLHLVTTREAEMHKYTHNLFNACKIAFFNEQRRVCERLSISADVVFPLVVESAEASWNPLYGTRDLGPFEGMCLPKDTLSFLNWAKQNLQLDLDVLQAIVSSNDALGARNSD